MVEVLDRRVLRSRFQGTETLLQKEVNMAKEYRNPTPTVDIIIEVEGGIILIQRKNPPLGWALPGGFVDYGESVEDGARREALEETSLEVTLVEQFLVYSDPQRDPRQHTLSTVFIARATGVPRAQDDASALEVFPLDGLPRELCFDHGVILGDFLHYRSTGHRPSFPGAWR